MMKGSISASVMNYVLLTAFLLTLMVNAAWSKVTCIDQSGQPVDWYIVYKLPKVKNKLPWVREGLGFYYLDANNNNWVMSDVPLNRSTNAVSYTLQQIYNNNKSPSVAYALYNDETPDRRVSQAHGHTKGAVCLDRDSGFWLVHSVPRFPQAAKLSYDYPSSGQTYGQTFICVTYQYKVFDVIGKQLMYNHPWIYDSNMPTEFATTLPALAEVMQDRHVTTPPYMHSTVLQSQAGQQFKVFSKAAKFNADIFHKWLAPSFSSDMQSETWQNGIGKLSSDCRGKYAVKNIQSIKFPAVQFKETKDHSKWAITTSPGKTWVCVGDVNRAHGQTVRGGGFVCINKKEVWRAFSDIVDKVEQCDTTLRFSPTF